MRKFLRYSKIDMKIEWNAYKIFLSSIQRHKKIFLLRNRKIYSGFETKK